MIKVPVSGGGGGTVDSVVAGNNVSVDSTDPANPIVNADAQLPTPGANGEVLTADSSDPTGWSSQPTSGSSGGGGYKGDWSAGTYNAGELVTDSGFLWGAKVSTTEKPISVSGATLSNVNSWTKYNTTPISSNEISLTELGVSEDCGLIISESVDLTSFIGGSSFDLTVPAIWNGDHDRMAIGLYFNDAMPSSGSVTNLTTYNQSWGGTDAVGVTFGLNADKNLRFWNGSSNVKTVAATQSQLSSPDRSTYRDYVLSISILSSTSFTITWDEGVSYNNTFTISGKDWSKVHFYISGRAYQPSNGATCRVKNTITLGEIVESTDWRKLAVDVGF